MRVYPDDIHALYRGEIRSSRRVSGHTEQLLYLNWCRREAGSQLQRIDFWRAMAMVMRSMVMCVVVVVVLGFAVETSQAQCDLSKLSACLTAVRADVKPTDACCQAVSGFNSDAGIACVCSASADPRFTSLGGKPQFAVLIPQKCNLRFKAGTLCNGLVIPGGQ